MRDKAKVRACNKAYVKTENGKVAKQRANLKFKAKVKAQKLMPINLTVNTTLLVSAMNNWR